MTVEKVRVLLERSLTRRYPRGIPLLEALDLYTQFVLVTTHTIRESPFSAHEKAALLTAISDALTALQKPWD